MADPQLNGPAIAVIRAAIVRLCTASRLARCGATLPVLDPLLVDAA